MGLLDKVKGILFDEEEIELPEIKKETKSEFKIDKNIEEDSIKEIKVPKDDFSDREYKSETTFTFPIDFDDEDIIPGKKEEKKEVREDYRSVKREEYKPINKVPEKRDYSEFLHKKEIKKQFKPTPIISPVYGVLDQNYKKEDVIVKTEILRKPTGLSLEEVRKRAFGSLEDELEQNLTTDTKEIKIKEEVKIKKETIVESVPKLESVEEPVDKMKTIGELIEEDNHKLDIPEIDSINDEEIEYTIDSSNDTEYKEPQNTIEDLLNEKEDIFESIEEEKEEKIVDIDDIDEEEADLFSLIDSMYEEKGE